MPENTPTSPKMHALCRACLLSWRSMTPGGVRRDEMSQEKHDVLELIRRLPDDVTTAAIMEELYFKQQVDKGLQDVNEGRVLSHEELKQRVARWRKSAGR